MRDWAALLKATFRPIFDNKLDRELTALRNDVDGIKASVSELQAHTGLVRAITEITEGKGE